MTAPPSLPAATAEPAAPMPPAAMRTKAAAPARPAPEPKRAAATSARESSTAPATAAASGAGGRGAAESRVYAASELPEEIRRDLPKVVIGGSSYSGDAASRMVMINGQVFHEGDRLAPNLVLEKIQRKSAVLAYKGWRYELAF
jgi:general secretion pathway protein B